MKVDNNALNIAQIQRPQQRPFSIDSGRNRNENVQIRPDSNRPREAKPSELLSKDEVDMLQGLFPEHKESLPGADVYLINRTKMPTSKIGSLVDLKG